MANYLNMTGFGAIASQLQDQREAARFQRKLLMDAYLTAKKKQEDYEAAANQPWRKIVGTATPLVGTAIGGIYGGPMGAAAGGAIGAAGGKMLTDIGMPNTPVDASPMLQATQPLFQQMAMKSLYDRYTSGPSSEELNAVYHNPNVGKTIPLGTDAPVRFEIDPETGLPVYDPSNPMG